MEVKVPTYAGLVTLSSTDSLSGDHHELHKAYRAFREHQENPNALYGNWPPITITYDNNRSTWYVVTTLSNGKGDHLVLRGPRNHYALAYSENAAAPFKLLDIVAHVPNNDTIEAHMAALQALYPQVPSELSAPY